MTSAPTLVLERLKTEFPQYAARGDQARSVAREIFHSERLVVPCKDTVELKLSVANVFSAAASALGRGEAVEIREDGELVRRCTPGDASALADEFRSRGRAGTRSCGCTRAPRGGTARGTRSPRRWRARGRAPTRRAGRSGRAPP